MRARSGASTRRSHHRLRRCTMAIRTPRTLHQPSVSVWGRYITSLVLTITNYRILARTRSSGINTSISFRLLRFLLLQLMVTAAAATTVIVIALVIVLRMVDKWNLRKSRKTLPPLMRPRASVGCNRRSTPNDGSTSHTKTRSFKGSKRTRRLQWVGRACPSEVAVAGVLRTEGGITCMWRL